jgi:peptidyl-prolyl cis-trans isomerase B (cyclophilin B)
VKQAHRQGLWVGAVVLVAAGALIMANTLPGFNPVLPQRLAVIKTDYGEITLRLRADKSPNAVASFEHLVREKFYDGLSFKMVMPEQGLIVGGLAPPERLSKWSIPDETNDLPFQRGSVAFWHPMEEPDANRGAFMIGLDSRPGYTEMVTIFAEVQSGMDVVERISKVPTTGANGNPPYAPFEVVAIRSITLKDDR